MSTQWLDWIAVGVAVVFAAAWLALRIRRNWRRQAEAKKKSGACASGCAGCPFSKGCGGQRA